VEILFNFCQSFVAHFVTKGLNLLGTARLLLANIHIVHGVHLLDFPNLENVCRKIVEKGYTQIGGCSQE